mmetsp:Transcript_33207/g.106017  ORF Transcript_33207/g.106017 Transcript_33207/m.106017 type:complete len:237 (+) Transcript_33207:882-1592(+)
MGGRDRRVAHRRTTTPVSSFFPAKAKALALSAAALAAAGPSWSFFGDGGAKACRLTTSSSTSRPKFCLSHARGPCLRASTERQVGPPQVAPVSVSSRGSLPKGASGRIPSTNQPTPRPLREQSCSRRPPVAVPGAKDRVDPVSSTSTFDPDVSLSISRKKHASSARIPGSDDRHRTPTIRTAFRDKVDSTSRARNDRAPRSRTLLVFLGAGCSGGPFFFFFKASSERTTGDVPTTA